MVIFKKIEVGLLSTNCYVIANPETREAVIFDPGADAEKIKNEISEQMLKPVAILLTHGHFDHIGAVKNLVTEYHIPVLIGEEEKAVLSDLHSVLPSPFYEHEKKRDLYMITPDRYVTDEELLELGGMYITCFHTPGHTEGGYSYFLPTEHAVICGDTLFMENIGRTDFPTGDEKTLIDSVQKKLFELPDETKVFPGHGPATNIEYEKRYNLYVRVSRRK